MNRNSALAQTWLWVFCAALSAADTGAASSVAAAGAQDALTAVRSRLPEDEIVYLIVPDRFWNGDRSNDSGGMTGDRSKTGFELESKAEAVSAHVHAMTGERQIK